MTFQNITMAKPSHLYLATKPYLNPAAASKPYLDPPATSKTCSSYSMEKYQQHGLHTQWPTF